MTYSSMLDRVDAAVGREQAGDAELATAQAFATAWALVGYALWVALWLLARVVVAIARLVARPWRSRDYGEWTTTMRRRGRVG